MRGLNSVSLGKMGSLEVAATSSDDLKVIVWQLDKSRQPLLELRTEHEIVVTQATLLDEERLATSCMDGQVRLSHLGKHQHREAQDRLLVQHRGAVYRIAAPPGSSELLLSGGEDGQVPQFKKVEKLIYKSAFRCSFMIFGFLILPGC